MQTLWVFIFIWKTKGSFHLNMLLGAANVTGYRKGLMHCLHTARNWSSWCLLLFSLLGQSTCCGSVSQWSLIISPYKTPVLKIVFQNMLCSSVRKFFSSCFVLDCFLFCLLIQTHISLHGLQIQMPTGLRQANECGWPVGPAVNHREKAPKRVPDSQLSSIRAKPGDWKQFRAKTPYFHLI